MTDKLDKVIAGLFYLLFFFVPIILFPKSSELFELNKMVLVYTLTILIVAAWFLRSLLENRIRFKRTMLDIPLVLFLISQVVSTATSIDQTTSIFGYYGRFHGGLLSSFAYALLYWAYVSNMDKQKTIKSIKFLLTTAMLVSIYAILQRFGIDDQYWSQDVKARVFSTLGQPNWLAAWIVSLMPLAWTLILSAKYKVQSAKSQLINQRVFLGIVVSIIFFLTLLFTKSRSGFLGFAAASVVFWSTSFWINRTNKKLKPLMIKSFIILNTLFIILVLIFGTPWTTSLLRSDQIVQNQSVGINITDSGSLRKHVWTAAINVFKENPVAGTGVETFAYSYNLYKPAEQNTSSEWNFIYNKAHNEYLNYMTNNGTLGLVTYLLLVFSALYLMIKDLKHTSLFPLRISLLAGYISILVTNFFGFSVVPVAINFFLFPAFAITLGIRNKALGTSKKHISNRQYALIVGVLLLTSYFLLQASRYWTADYLYSKGRSLNLSENYLEASQNLEAALKLHNNPVYSNELSKSYSELALSNFENNVNGYDQLISKSLKTSQNAIDMSPFNVSLLKNRANIYTNLSGTKSGYLNNAIETMLLALAISPNDPAIYYRLGLTFNRIGDTKSSEEFIKQAINLKPNYKEARIALFLIYKDQGKKDEANMLLLYILDNVNPNDKDIIKLLE